MQQLTPSMNTNLQSIKNKLVDRSLLGIVIFMPPMVISSLFRALQTGWSWIYNIHLVLAAITFAIYFFRSKMTIALKTHFICCLFLAGCIAGTFRSGLSSSFYFCLGAVSVSTLVLGKRIGWLYVSISSIYLTCFAILYSNRIIKTSIDYNVYNLNATTWINVLLTIFFIMVSTILAIGLFHEHFTQSIQELTLINTKQAIIQEELKKTDEQLKEQNEEYLSLNEELRELNIEYKKAKDKAEESDQLKTAFLQNISHEIRTPLNAITGFSSLLCKPDLSYEKRKEYVSFIMNSSQHLISIVSDILTISSIELKHEKPNLRPVNINEVIRDVFEIYQKQENSQRITFSICLSQNDDKTTILTDKIKLEQILCNLLNNAVKFTHEGEIECGYYIKQDMIEFFVRDTGIGIESAMHSKIFARFMQVENGPTREYGGNGLGLSISKGFIELLGGEIWIKSEIGKGSTFFFTLPYQQVQINNRLQDCPAVK